MWTSGLEVSWRSSRKSIYFCARAQSRERLAVYPSPKKGKSYVYITMCMHGSTGPVLQGKATYSGDSGFPADKPGLVSLLTPSLRLPTQLGILSLRGRLGLPPTLDKTQKTWEDTGGHGNLGLCMGSPIPWVTSGLNLPPFLIPPLGTPWPIAVALAYARLPVTRAESHWTAES